MIVIILFVIRYRNNHRDAPDADTGKNSLEMGERRRGVLPSFSPRATPNFDDSVSSSDYTDETYSTSSDSDDSDFSGESDETTDDSTEPDDSENFSYDSSTDTFSSTDSDDPSTSSSVERRRTKLKISNL